MSDSENPYNFNIRNQLDGEKDIDIGQGKSPELRPEIPEAESERTQITAIQEKDEDLFREDLQKINEEKKDASVSSSSDSEKSYVAGEDEDNDGFRTPISPDHRIPAPTECPPAPKKAWPPPKNYLKRKGSSPPAACRSLRFDDQSEVESFFRSTSDEDKAEELKIKKARRDDED